MRKFAILSISKKCKRILFNVLDFLRFKIWGSYRRGGICGFYHWVRCHTWNRYHIINLKKHAHEYDWGWIDRDHAMFLACFHLLCEFVEKEDPQIGTRQFTDYVAENEQQYEWARKHLENQLAVDKEIRALYDWWKTGRVLDQKRIDDIPLEFSGFHIKPEYEEQWNLYLKLSDEFEKKDDEMLNRLIKIRGYLWT